MKNYSTKRFNSKKFSKNKNYGFEDDLDWDNIEEKVAKAFRKETRRIHRTRKQRGKKWFEDEL